MTSLTFAFVIFEQMIVVTRNLHPIDYNREIDKLWSKTGYGVVLLTRPTMDDHCPFVRAHTAIA